MTDMAGLLLSHPLLVIADAYVQNLDPFAWRITDNFGIRWYGLAYAMGFVCAYVIALRLASTKRIRMSTQEVSDYVMACVVGVLVGGRLGWCIFYHPEAFIEFTKSPPFWEALAINHGGMASHGGMIGVIIAMAWFAHRHKLEPFDMLDLSALVVPFGLFFGRIANFVNGELRGQPCSPTFPLSVKFPQEIVEDWTPEKYGKLTDLAPQLFNLPKQQWKDLVAQANGGSKEAMARLHDYGNQILEGIQHSHKDWAQLVAPYLTPVHPSQLYEALAEGIVLALILWTVFLWRKPRRPGVISCVFLVVYGILRIITEIWRVPDAGIPRTLGLSRGQLLSTIMIVSGIGLYWWLRKHKPVRAPLPSISNEKA